MSIHPTQGQLELRGNHKEVLCLVFWILAIYTHSVSETIYHTHGIMNKGALNEIGAMCYQVVRGPLLAFNIGFTFVCALQVEILLP